MKTDQALAQFLGVSKSAINQSRSKGTADLWNILDRCQGWDLNWLFRGASADPLAMAAAELRTKGLRMILEPLPAPQAPGSP